MALDPKTTKQLNALIKNLATSSEQISAKSREFITLVYAIQQGFVNIGDKMEDVLSDVASGAFESKNFNRYLKELGLTEDQLKSIKIIHESIMDLTDDQIERTEDYTDILSEVYRRERDRYDLTEKTISAFESLNKEIEKQESLLKATGKISGDTVDSLVNQARKHGEITNAFKNEIISAQEINEQMRTVEDVIANIGASKFEIDGKVNLNPQEAVSVLNSVSEKQQKLIQQEEALRVKKLQEFAAFTKGMRFDMSTGDIFDSSGLKLSGEALKEQKTIIEEIAKTYDNYVDHIIKHGKLTESLRSSLSDIEYEIVQQAADAKQLNGVYGTLLEKSQLNLETLLKFRPAIRGATEASNALADSVQSMVDVLPKGMQRFLGIQNAAEDIRESSLRAISKFNSELVKTGSSSKAVNAAFKEWGGGLSRSLGMVGGITVALAGLFALTKMISGKYNDMADQLHITVAQAKNLYKANLDLVASQKNQFLTMKEIADVQAAYVHSTGQVFGLAEKGGQKLAMELAEISKIFGYSAETAVELYEVFSQLGADKEFANSLQRQLGFMSEMAGISSELVAKDLINASEEVATYFAGMPEEAGKAAIQVRRLGLDLKRAGQFAKSMLDIEGFMTDMFELAAMGGPDISAAFELGIQGDAAGALEAAMDSIGSLTDFNNLHFTQRLKLAKAMGMEVDELQKSLMLRQKLAGMSEDEKTRIEANLEQYGNIEGMDQKAIRARLAQLDSTERLNVAWEKIKAVLIRSILPAVEGFADMLDGIAPIIDVIIGAFKFVGIVIKGISKIVKGMLAPLGWIGDAVKYIASFFGDVDEGIKSVEKSLSGLGTAAEWVGTAISSIFLGRAAWGGISKLFGGLTGKVEGVAAAAEKVPKTGLFSRLFGKVPTGKIAAAKSGVSGLIGRVVKYAKGGGFLPRLFGKTPIDELTSAKQGVGGIAQEVTKQTPKKGFLSTMFGEFKPKIKIKGFKLKNLIPKMPKWLKLPEFKMPKIPVPKLPKLPKFGIPKIPVPKLPKLPKFGIPKIPVPKLPKLPKFGIPKIPVPKLPMPKLPKITGFVDKLLEKFKIVPNMFGDMIGKMKGMLPKKEFFSKILGKIPTGVVSKFTGIVKNMTSSVMGMLPKKEFFSKILGKIPTGTVRKFTGIVKNMTSSVMGMLPKGGILNYIVGKMPTGLIGKAKDTLGNLVSGVAKKIPVGGFVKRIFGKVPKGAASMTANTMSDVVSKTAAKLPKFGFIKRIFGDIPRGIVSKVADVAKRIASSVMSRLPVGSVLSKIFGKIPTGLIGKAKDKMGGLLSTIKGKMPKIGIFDKLLGKAKDKTIKNTMTTVTETIAPKSSDVGELLPKDAGSGITKKLGKLKKMIGGGLNSLGSFIKSGLKTAAKYFKKGLELIKDVVFTLTDMIVGVMTKFAKGVGKVIKSLLKGIGDGLESFGTKAIKGAAAMAILSGALWITSKAVQNFADVSWNDVGKAAATLGGLVIASAMLGKASSSMMQGAAAIAMLGASLIPAAYALNMFADVSWDDIGKAGATLIGLAGVAMVMGKASASMLLGALGIAALGAALIPAAYALNMFADVEWGDIAKAGVSIIGLGIAGSLLAGMAGPMMLGAAGLAAMSLALIPAAKALEMFSNVEWESLAKAGAVMAGLGIAGALLSVAAPVMVAGAAGLAAMGIALIPVAAAFDMMSGLDMESISATISMIGSLGIVGAKLGLVSPALVLGAGAVGLLGIALIPFSVALKSLNNIEFSKIGTGLGNLAVGLSALSFSSLSGGLSSLFMGDPFEKLEQLADIANPLDIAAKAINMLGESIVQLSNALEVADFRKLSEFEKLKGFASQVGVGFKIRRPDAAPVIQPPSPQATAQNLAIPEPPSSESTAQDVVIKETTPTPVSNTTPPSDPVQQAIDDATAGSGNKKIEMLLGELVREIRGLNKRPMILEFSDGTIKTLNYRIKGLNGNR